MKVKLDLEASRRILQEITSYMQRKEQDRREIRRTDLVHCLRKSYYRIKGHPEAYPLEDKALAMFIGESVHEKYQSLHPDCREVEVEVAGVKGHVDLMLNGYPVEVKTTAMPLFSRDLIPSEWMEQLKLAIAATGRAGYLLVFSLVDKSISMFRVELTRREIKETLERFSHRRKLLEEAIMKGRAEDLPPNLSECEGCEYKDACWRK